MNKKLLILSLSCLAVLSALAGVFYYSRISKNRLLEIKVASGRIREINGGSVRIINIKDPTVPLDVNDQSNFRIFNLNKDTKFYKYSDNKKTETQFVQEQAAFNALVDGLKNQNKNIVGLEPPDWYPLEEVGLSYLKPDMSVGVFVLESDRGTEQVAATKIIVDRLVPAAEYDLPADMKPMAEVTGKIKKVDANGLTILPDQAIPAATSTKAEEKIFGLDASTQVYERRQKTEQEFSKEQAAFNDRLPGGDTSLDAPSWYKETAIKVTDLRVGQKVQIEASGDEDRLIARRIYLTVK